MMKKFISLYFLYLTILLAMDFLWLYTAGPIFYKKHLGYLMGEKIVIMPVLVFYLLYALTITVFILNPVIINQESSFVALLNGLLFGLCSYGTYNLTNHATIKNWPMIVTMIDMGWGSFVTGVSVLIAVVLFNTFFFKYY